MRTAVIVELPEHFPDDLPNTLQSLQIIFGFVVLLPAHLHRIAQCAHLRVKLLLATERGLGFIRKASRIREPYGLREPYKLRDSYRLRETHMRNMDRNRLNSRSLTIVVWRLGSSVTASWFALR